MKHIYTLVVFLFAAFSMNAQEVISCAQALDLMPASSDAATKQEYVVVGYVTAALKRYYLPATEDKPEKDLAETVEGGTLIVIPPEGIETVSGKPSSSMRKMLDNGQLVIIRDDVRYNALGIRIR